MFIEQRSPVERPRAKKAAKAKKKPKAR